VHSLRQHTFIKDRTNMASQRRKDTNFFEKLSITSTSFVVKAKWNFTSLGLALMVESSNITDVIQYSFDGETVHGDLTPTMPSEGIIFDNRFENTVWFRRATAGSSVIVRVEAWRGTA
jgi:hypothetical protein